MSLIQHSILKAISVSMLLLAGCSKFIEVGPPKTETIVGTTVYNNDAGAEGALIGIYGRMINSTGFAGGYNRSVTYLAALSADELTSYSGLAIPKQFYENAIAPNNTAIENALWNEVYQYIYYANAVIEGVQNPDISADARRVILAEALFIRAFCHFYLVNLYGDVPLITGTDYMTNMQAARTPKETVYRRIIDDLRTAQGWLSDDYRSYPSAARIRPNRSAATALLARVYLYRKDWVNAAAQADAVIRNGQYALEDLNNVFLSNSREAIWQLSPNTPTQLTWEGSNFILTTAPTMTEINSATVSTRLLDAFEDGDLRRSSWIDSVMVDTFAYYFPYKYKVKRADAGPSPIPGPVPAEEYSMVLRLAEQYLVRAEARVYLGDFAGARADINMVRTRAGLPDITANTLPALLAAVEHERQVELFTEWGHRWFDLKRTGRADAVLGYLKAPGWQPTDVLYPIPQNEMLKNSSLRPQNPGYE